MFDYRKATTGEKKYEVFNVYTGEVVRRFTYRRDAEADVAWLTAQYSRPSATIEELVAFATDTAGQW
jgi:hypothetical protein